MRFPLVVLKVVAWILVVLAPTLGVWVASSVAAYLNGPVWLACLAGLFLFPLFPLGWDLLATRRFVAKQDKRKAAGRDVRARRMGFWDRMILRTFLVNVAFVVALLATFPQTGFTALATRGDWFLDTADPSTAAVLRPVVLVGAEALEWLYEWSRENPYEKYQDEIPTPLPTPTEFGETKPHIEAPSPEVVSPVAPRPGDPPTWPMKAALHPVVANMPAAVETDYASVASYIAERERDPFLRVKALHDYVADRLAYDVVALRSGDFGSQKPRDVFERRMAVCAGYSQLLEAMGKVTGDEIIYVVGVSRDKNGDIAGGGHAWNAAKIRGKWYLIDATWDAGFVNDGEPFEKHYRTNYLFTPPAVFGSDHFPDAAAWQLRAQPVSRAEFVRQPLLEPEFWAQGLELVNPTRSQVSAASEHITVHLLNPRGIHVHGRVFAASGEKGEQCDTQGTTDLRVTCPVPEGVHKVRLFAGPEGDDGYPFVGQFEVTSK